MADDEDEDLYARMDTFLSQFSGNLDNDREFEYGIF